MADARSIVICNLSSEVRLIVCVWQEPPLVNESAWMSLINPAPRTGIHKGGKRRNENNITYALTIPLALSAPEHRKLHSVLGLLGLSTTSISNPQCEGYLDVATRSVWVANSRDSMILWRRGFFGKADLSRSEPSWLARQINARKSGANRTPYLPPISSPARSS
jgi:hypothetical protein